MLLYTKNPAHPAIIHEADSTLTYGQLAEKINQLSNLLIHHGIKASDRIGLFLYNCPELIISYYACWQINAIAMPINNRLKSAEILRLLADTKPQLIITQALLSEELISVTAKILLIEELDWSSTASAPPRTDINPQPATIHFTSGTTATSKAVVHNFNVIPLIAKTAAAALNYTPNDQLLVCQSLAHGFGYSMQMLPGLFAGCTLRLLPKFEVERVFTALVNQPITVICLLPGFCFELVQYAERQAKFAHHLRYCIVAGDPVTRTLFERFHACFGIPPSINYGMTESVLLSLNLNPEHQQAGSAGKPLANVQIKTVDNAYQELPAGVTGEILVSSPYLFSHYWQDPLLTQQSFHQGWLITDDWGCIDQQGRLWLQGRQKLLLSKGGSKFAAQEVETAFYQHPLVKEAGVVGIVNEVDTTVLAFVVLAAGAKLQPAELLAFISPLLADYKLPEQIIFVKALPKTSSGKLDREQLLAWAESTLLMFN